MALCLQEPEPLPPAPWCTPARTADAATTSTAFGGHYRHRVTQHTRLHHQEQQHHHHQPPHGVALPAYTRSEGGAGGCWGNAGALGVGGAGPGSAAGAAAAAVGPLQQQYQQQHQYQYQYQQGYCATGAEGDEGLVCGSGGEQGLLAQEVGQHLGQQPQQRQQQGGEGSRPLAAAAAPAGQARHSQLSLLALLEPCGAHPHPHQEEEQQQQQEHHDQQQLQQLDRQSYDWAGQQAVQGSLAGGPAGSHTAATAGVEHPAGGAADEDPCCSMLSIFNTCTAIDSCSWMPPSALYSYKQQQHWEELQEQQEQQQHQPFSTHLLAAAGTPGPAPRAMEGPCPPAASPQQDSMAESTLAAVTHTQQQQPQRATPTRTRLPVSHLRPYGSHGGPGGGGSSGSELPSLAQVQQLAAAAAAAAAGRAPAFGPAGLPLQLQLPIAPPSSSSSAASALLGRGRSVLIRGGQSLILHPTILESEREGELEGEGSGGSCMLQLVPSSSGAHHRLSIEELSTPVGAGVGVGRLVGVWAGWCGCGCGLVGVGVG